MSRHSWQMPLLPHTDHAQEKAGHSPQHSHQGMRLAQLEAHNHDRRAGQRCSSVDILPAPPAAVAPAASHPTRGMTGASAVRRLACGLRGWLPVAREKNALKIPIRSRGRSGRGHCCAMASAIACKSTVTSPLPRLSVSATISCRLPGYACRRLSSSRVPPVVVPCLICRRLPSASIPYVPSQRRQNRHHGVHCERSWRDG